MGKYASPKIICQSTCTSDVTLFGNIGYLKNNRRWLGLALFIMTGILKKVWGGEFGQRNAYWKNAM
jgi:hypothetical protein